MSQGGVSNCKISTNMLLSICMMWGIEWMCILVKWLQWVVDICINNIIFDPIKTILMIVGLIIWFQTPLYYAACGGHLEVVKLLVSSGADIDVKNVLIFFYWNDFDAKEE